MKNIKNIVALAVAAAIMSPMAAMADNTPTNVGNVTYLGNIVANSPMWQWTVNDYPGPRLDAKPSDATTVDGVTTYPLAGQPFIAVSGFLPSMSGIIGPGTTSLGTRDITQFSDGNGSPIGDIQPLDEPQAVSFTLSAVSTGTNGAEAVGTLTVKATEVRGYRIAQSPVSNPGQVLLYTAVYTGTNPRLPVVRGSCFVGQNGIPLGVSGTALQPAITGGSATAAAAYTRALAEADETGAITFAGVAEGLVASTDRTIASAAQCLDGSPNSYTTATPSTSHKFLYVAAGHIVELTPTELAFNTPVQGAWNATLNVTAYQM